MSRPPPAPPPPPPCGPSRDEVRRQERAFILTACTTLGALAAIMAWLGSALPEQPAVQFVAKTPEGCRIYAVRNGGGMVTICPAGWVAAP